MKANKGTNPLTNERGVTLIEAMIYVAMAGMLLATAMTAFIGQNKSYNRQDVISEIQQNLRGATEQMASDIRFAGIGLHETSDEAFDIAEAESFSVNYWSDLSEYWRFGLTDKKKTIHYRLADSNIERAYRELGGSSPLEWEVIAENIDILKFEYQVDTGDPPASWEWFNQIPKAGEPYDIEDIRAVKIMVLGTSRESAFNQSVDGTFEFPMDDVAFTHTPAPNSGYKRLMSTVVQARNNRDN